MVRNDVCCSICRFESDRRGGSSRPGGWRGRRNLQCSSAQGQAANQRSYLRVIGPRKNNISTNETEKDGSLKRNLL